MAAPLRQKVIPPHEIMIRQVTVKKHRLCFPWTELIHIISTTNKSIIHLLSFPLAHTAKRVFIIIYIDLKDSSNTCLARVLTKSHTRAWVRLLRSLAAFSEPCVSWPWTQALLLPYVRQFQLQARGVLLFYHSWHKACVVTLLCFLLNSVFLGLGHMFFCYPTLNHFHPQALCVYYSLIPCPKLVLLILLPKLKSDASSPCIYKYC